MRCAYVDTTCQSDSLAGHVAKADRSCSLAVDLAAGPGTDTHVLKSGARSQSLPSVCVWPGVHSEAPTNGLAAAR